MKLWVTPFVDIYFFAQEIININKTSDILHSNSGLILNCDLKICDSVSCKRAGSELKNLRVLSCDSTRLWAANRKLINLGVAIHVILHIVSGLQMRQSHNARWCTCSTNYFIEPAHLTPIPNGYYYTFSTHLSALCPVLTIQRQDISP